MYPCVRLPFLAGKPTSAADPRRPFRALPGRPFKAMTAHSYPSRRGFTLIELLVVLVIMASLAALVLSGIFRGKDTNRLLGAEHMLADAVRQARHTARSSGAPVELRLTPVVDGTQVVGARMAGVSRTPIFHETFDGPTAVPIAALGAGYDTMGNTLGRSGNGRVVGPGTSAGPTVPPPYDSTDSHLEGLRLLARGATQNGFYLSCAARPPLASTLLTEPNPNPNVAPQTFIPLVLVGSPTSADMNASQCGLALWLSSKQVDVPGGGTYFVRSWDLKGWVRGDGPTTAPVEISSLDNPPDDHAADREPLEDGKADVANPIAGGAWEEFGLLYDGERLVLYRNGQRVGVLTTGVPTVLAKLAAARVWVGQLADPLAPADDLYTAWANASLLALPQATVLDDIRLDRLGTDQLGELPRGIVLIPGLRQSPTTSLAYRIVAHPDGRVEVLQDGVAAPLNAKRATAATGSVPQLSGFLTSAATITVSQRLSTDGAHSARLTVGIDGRVNSMLFPAQ